MVNYKEELKIEGSRFNSVHFKQNFYQIYFVIINILEQNKK